MTTRPVTQIKQHNIRGRARRAVLLDAAVEVVAEHGIAGVTHRAVSERAGFPPSTASYFFPSIDDLLIEAMSEAMARNTDRYEDLSRLIESDELTADELIDAFVRLLVDIPASAALAQFDLYLTAARREQVRPYAIAMIDAFRQLAESALARVGVDQPATAAIAVVAAIDGLALHRAACGSSDQQFERELRAVLDSVLAQHVAAVRHADAAGARRTKLRVVSVP